MPRITINEVNKSLGLTNTYDIVNAIRNSNPSSFGQYVPLANADNVEEVGHAIQINQTLQNEFITELVDRISLIVIRSITLTNPLKIFKKGMMPLGKTIEEIFTDIAKEQKYDMEAAESDVFKRTIPNVKVLFHERNRQSKYPQTISDEDLASAFTSWGAFGNFVTSIIQAIYNAAEVDEFKYMKLAIDNYYAKGLFTVVPVPHPDTATAATEFVKKARATATKMTLPMGSRDYNALAVQTRTTPNDLYLIIDADIAAEVDVDVLAKAFNMDRTTFIGRQLIIDGLASSGLEAVLVDQNWFMIYDNLLKLETIRNPSGLYWNYFYHVWQTISTSRFANAVAFVSGPVKEVTQVIVDPTIAAVKAGRTFTFTAYVRTTDKVDREVVWSVEPSNSDTTLAPGTTIAADGTLTVGAEQLGELSVKATVSVDPNGTPDSGDEYKVVGESIVSII